MLSRDKCLNFFGGAFFIQTQGMKTRRKPGLVIDQVGTLNHKPTPKTEAVLQFLASWRSTEDSDHALYQNSRGQFFIRLGYSSDRDFQPVTELEAIRDWLNGVSPSERWTKLILKAVRAARELRTRPELPASVIERL